LELKKRNRFKFKMIILISLIIGIDILILFSISLFSVRGQSEEISKFYVNETKLNTQEVLYTIKADDEEEKKENIEEQNYQTGEQEYFLKVNYTAQTVTVYGKDENGYYSKPLKVMLCSTGTNTPKTGTYKITYFKKEWLALQGKVYGQYCTQIVGDILFHSVPYLEYGNPESLEYWEYDKLGQEASLGCIRLTVKDAKWIFDNCNAGTKVEFYSSDNPGPLGRPEIEKISQNEELRNWDPTDEKEQNPWIPYLEERKNKIEELNKVIKIIQKVSKIMKM
jgi:lipoprotein-anchoring transpeptidase ErfK/SrfK